MTRSFNLFFVFVLFLFTNSYAQNGWREKEMEVKVFLQNKEDAAKLHELHLNGDVYSAPGYGLMYVVPQEFEKIKSSGFQYEILKADLNKYYKNFWQNQQRDTNAALQEQYHSYDQIISLMDSLVAAFPSICKKVSYGTSVQNRQLCALKISDNVNTEESEAEVLIDGGIHGDEIGGAENTIRFARYLCTNYTTNPKITGLINNREIWIYPMVNPDGRVNTSRYNGNSVDVNRDFGYMWNGEGSSSAAYSQPEAKAIRNCIYENQFSIHLSCHSGSQNVFYPWCYKSGKSPNYTNFNTLSNVYSKSSTYPNLTCMQSNADYATTGELDDCSYGINGTVGMVLEISTNKQPSASTELMKYYQYNLPAMISLVEYSGYGVEGVVTDSITGIPVPAIIFADNFYPVYADPTVGDYHKFLSAGSYSLKIKANNYKTKTISNIAVADKASVLTNIKLEQLKGHYAYRIVSAVIPGNNPADEGNTPAVIGSPDQINYSVGKSGTVVIDMQYPVADITGNDIKVYEGDNSPEGYKCYAAQSMDGPWKLLGTGNGTTLFDLQSASLANAQFIKIVDAGSGSANVADAGFDLDAIEDLGNTLTTVEQKEISINYLSVYPNPVQDIINITYSVTQPTTAKITLYNSLGEKVKTIIEEKNKEGIHSIAMNSSYLKPGVYFCTLETDGEHLPVTKCIVKF